MEQLIGRRSALAAHENRPAEKVALPAEAYVNGELAGEATTIGYGESLAYCRGEGQNTISVRALDTSGNASAPSNEIALPASG